MEESAKIRHMYEERSVLTEKYEESVQRACKSEGSVRNWSMIHLECEAAWVNLNLSQFAAAQVGESVRKSDMPKCKGALSYLA